MRSHLDPIRCVARGPGATTIKTLGGQEGKPKEHYPNLGLVVIGDGLPCRPVRDAAHYLAAIPCDTVLVSLAMVEARDCQLLSWRWSFEEMPKTWRLGRRCKTAEAAYCSITPLVRPTSPTKMGIIIVQ